MRLAMGRTVRRAAREPGTAGKTPPREIRCRGDGAPQCDLTSIQQVHAMPFRQYVMPAHAKLVISGCVTPHFKGGLRQARALRPEVNRQGPRAPAAAPFQFNPLAGL